MVEFLLGRREQHSYIEESAYGTALTPTMVLARNARFEPRDDVNWQEIKGSGEDTITVDDMEVGPETFGGTLRFAPQNWDFLKFVLCNGGASVSDVNEGTYYSHTFTLTNKERVSFTYERAMQHTTAHVITYEGCQVNTCTISWDSAGGEGNALMEVALDITAEDRNTGSSVTSLSAPITAAFQFRNVLLTINGNEITELVGGSMVIENNIHDGRYANYTLNKLRAEGVPLIMRIHGTFRVKIKDSTWDDLFDTAAEISSTNTLVFRRATNDDVTFTLSGLRLGPKPDPTNLDGINEVTVNWTAEKFTSVIAKDSISSY